jgi:hypothetical protein
MIGSSLPPVVYMRTHALFTLSVFGGIQWCPTHICVVILFCFSLSCVASFSGLSILIGPLVFSNVYLLSILFILGDLLFSMPQASYHQILRLLLSSG